MDKKTACLPDTNFMIRFLFLSFHAYLDEGEVFSWGNNEYGQLAIDSDEEQVCMIELMKFFTYS